VNRINATNPFRCSPVGTNLKSSEAYADQKLRIKFIESFRSLLSKNESIDLCFQLQLIAFIKGKLCEITCVEAKGFSATNFSISGCL
jgi:hypothetical protein